MATEPDLDVVNAIAAAIPKWIAGSNLFQGKVRAANDRIPREAVFCLASGGPGIEAYMASSLEQRFSAVQVRVRSDPRKFLDGQQDARNIQDALHNQDLSGYTDVRAMQTEPVYVGEDEDGLHEWSVNLELWHEE